MKKTTIEKLKEKHPVCPSDRRAFPISPQDTHPLRLTSEVKTAVLSFPNGSAGGLSGLRPQHLKDCIGKVLGDQSNKLITALTDVCNDILRGETPTEIIPLLAGANLSAFVKKDGGIRPIAVGETIRRLVGKTTSTKLTQAFKDSISPLNLGFAVESGAEAAVHAVRALLENPTNDDVSLKKDFANDFNSIRRDYAAKCIAEKCPELLPFFKTCYETTTPQLRRNHH